jgi:hypothetical protein
MIEVLENLKFMERSSSHDFALGGVGSGHRIKPHAADRVSSGVLGVEILVRKKRILLNELLQHVVPDPPLALGGPDARLIKRLDNPSGRRPVDCDSMCGNGPNERAPQ